MNPQAQTPTIDNRHTDKRLLLIGHGYVAAHLTPLAREAGWSVTGTTRNDPDRVTASGAQALIWDGVDAEALRAAAQGADAILSSVAPVGGVDPVVSALAGIHVPWLGYLSATSVYGDAGGGWADEASPTAPTSERGRNRLVAEAAWRDWAEATGAALHIFRLSGIYGPHRSPFAQLRAGRARRIVKPGQVFSRIHVTDIARAIMAALGAPHPGAIWNLADLHPAPPQDVILEAARLANLPAPPEEDFATVSTTMSPAARAFYADSRRIDAGRIRDALNWTPLYPDYHSGLAACLRAEAVPAPVAGPDGQHPAPSRAG